MQERLAQNVVQDAGLIGRGGCFGRPVFFWKNDYTRRGRVSASADLGPLKSWDSGWTRGRVRPEVGLVWADVRG